MKEKNEFELIVSQRNRPIWQTLIAAAFFSIMLYELYLVILIYYQEGVCEHSNKVLPYFVKSISYTLVGGIFFSVTKTVLIDSDKGKLISRFYVGPIYKDVRSNTPELEYVSVFLDGKGCYQVNLWYKGNKHYNMFSFEEKKPAMQFAADVAIKLNLDLLDATEKGNFHRVDKYFVKN